MRWISRCLFITLLLLGTMSSVVRACNTAPTAVITYPVNPTFIHINYPYDCFDGSHSYDDDGIITSWY